MDEGDRDSVGQGLDAAGQPEQAQQAEQSVEAGRSRRDFLNGSARKLAYAAPLVLLFHPKPACASNGSTLTYWDSVEGTTKQR